MIDKKGQDKEVALTLFNRFCHRCDFYAVQQPDGRYYRIDDPLTLEVLERHLRGEVTVARYQLAKDNTVKDLCWDLDPEHVQDPKVAAERIIQACLEKPDGKNPRIWRKAVLLEASRYPDPSYHIYALFSLFRVPARVARWLGLRILELAGLNPKQIEIFPKQCELTEDRPYGNCVKLPLGKHRVADKWSKFLDLNTFDPLPNDVVHQVEGISFSEADVEKIMSLDEKRALQTRFELPRNFRSLHNKEEEKAVRFLCKYWKPGYRNQLELSFLGWCLKKGISHESAYRIIQEVAERTNDEEKSSRLRLVGYHYRNRMKSVSILKGISGIREIVEEMAKNECSG